MTLPLRLLFYSLWIAPHVLQIIILILLIRRGLCDKFPIFASYVAFGLCEFVTLFLASQFAPSYAAYFKWYAFGLGVGTALRFGIISEIFAHVFGNHSALHNVERPLFRWTTVALLVIAFSFAIYTHRADTDPRWFAVYVLDRSASIVQCGLILALFLFSAYMGLSWSRLVFGMALGLGVLCSLELAVAAMRSRIGHSAHIALDLLTMGTYLCCVLIWLFYLLAPQRSPMHLVDKLPDGDLETWNQELEQLLHR